MVVRELHLALAEQNTPNRKSDAHKTKSITKQKEVEKDMSKKNYWLCHMTGVCSENFFNTTWRVTDLVSHRPVRHKVMALQQDPLQELSLTRTWTQMDFIRDRSQNPCTGKRGLRQRKNRVLLDATFLRASK